VCRSAGVSTRPRTEVEPRLGRAEGIVAGSATAARSFRLRRVVRGRRVRRTLGRRNGCVLRRRRIASARRGRSQTRWSTSGDRHRSATRTGIGRAHAHAFELEDHGTVRSGKLDQNGHMRGSQTRKAHVCRLSSTWFVKTASQNARGGTRWRLDITRHLVPRSPSSKTSTWYGKLKT